MDAFPTASSQSIDALLAESAWVRGLAARLVGADEADDLLQETWLRAVRKPPATDRPLRPWLATVVRNLARQRAAKRTELVSSDEAHGASSGSEAPEVWLERLETQELLSRLVRELPAEDRNVVLLRFYEGLDSRAIGRRLGQPDGTVRWRLKRAVEALRERLDARHDGDRSAWMAALVPLARLDSATVQAGTLSTLLMIGIAMPLALKLTLGATAALLLAWLLQRPDDVGVAPLLATNDDARAVAEETNAPERVAASQPTSPSRDSARSAAAAADEGEELVAPTVRPETSLTLRAVDEHGTPVPGAVLRVTRGYDFGNSDDEGFKAWIEELTPQELAVISAGGIEVTTGSDGRAELASRLVYQRSWISLNVVGPNHGLWHGRREVDPGDSLDLGDVVLLPGGAIAGRVFDEHGDPFRAIVRLTPAPESEAGLDDAERNERRVQGPATNDLPSGNSDRSGEYSLAGVPAGRYRVWAHVIGQPGLWSWSEPVEVALGERTEIDLQVATEELAPHVRVLTPDGEPHPKARVEFVRPNGYRQSGPADEDGRYFVGKLFQPGMSVTVEDNRGEFGPSSMNVVRTMSAIELRLTPVERAERKLVLRDASGERIESGNVRIDVNDNDSWYDLTSEPTTLHLPPVGTPFDLSVRTAGWKTRHFESITVAELTDPENDDTIAITLDRLAGIRGRVVRDGNPVARAWVRLGTPMGDSGWAWTNGVVSRVRWAKPVRTESDGSFQFLVADPGAQVLYAERSGRSGGRSEPFVIEDYDPEIGHANIELVLEATAELTGRVTDAAGRPVADRYVAAAHPQLPGETARTDEDGRYRIRALPAGDWYVYLMRNDPGEANGWSTGSQPWEFPSNVSLAPGESGECNVQLGMQALRLDLAFEVPAENEPALTAEVVGDFENPLRSWSTEAVRLGLESDVRELSLDYPGHCALVVTIESQDATRSYLRRSFDVEPEGIETVALDLSWRLVEGQVVAFDETDSRDLYLSAGFDDWTWNLSTKLREDGSFGPVLAPQGLLTLSRNVRRGAGREKVETLLDLSAESSASIEID